MIIWLTIRHSFTLEDCEKERKQKGDNEGKLLVLVESREANLKLLFSYNFSFPTLGCNDCMWSAPDAMFFPVLWSLDRQWACRMHCSCLYELCWLLDVTCLLANCRAYIRADRDFGWALSRQSFPLPLGSEWCPDLVSCNWLPNADCGDSLEWPADENDSKALENNLLLFSCCSIWCLSIFVFVGFFRCFKARYRISSVL